MKEVLLCGMLGFVVIEILCRPTDILGWWPPLLRKWLKLKPKQEFKTMKPLQLAIFKPLAGCGTCFAGWVCIFHLLIGIPDFVFFIAGGILVAECLGMLQTLYDKFLIRLKKAQNILKL